MLAVVAEEDSLSEKETGGCFLEQGLGGNDDDQDEWLEETVWYGMRMWHVIFLSIGAALAFIILLCCCFKFRIPRTKQEIEGDYIRRRIMRKFRKRLKAIQNQELDEMDLKKALDKIRTELKSDTESLQQSDVLSGATLSSAGGINQGGTYRRASQIQIDISLEDLRIQSMGLGARIALAFTRFFNRPNKAPSPQEESGIDNNIPEGSDKPTTALLPKSDKDSKKIEVETATDKKAKAIKKAGEQATTSTTTPENPKDKDKKKDKGGNKKEEEAKPVPTTTITTEKETKKPAKNGKKEKVEKASSIDTKESGKEASKKEKEKPSSDKKTESQKK